MESKFGDDWPKIKVLLVQHYPVLKEIDANINFCSKLLDKYSEKDSIDIVVFPELALTGSVFDGKKDIEPFCDYYYKGKAYDFCSQLAKKLKCWVIMGFPEKYWDEKKQKTRFFNSAMIVDPIGDPHKSYKKHVLNDLDKKWSKKPKEDKGGFLSIDTKSGERVKIQIGISDDINPYDNENKEKCEFACKCIEKEVNLIIVLGNWTYQGTPEEEGKYMMDWLYRFKPFHDDKYKKKIRNRNVYILFSNRTGKEKKVHFVGTSCILQINPEIKVKDNLNITEEKTLYSAVEI